MSRLELHDILKGALPIEHQSNLYFQPPESLKIKYPCIIYKLSDITMAHASDEVYRVKKRYMVTLITTDPDNTIVDDILKIRYCSFNRFYTNDNLNHYVFTLYY